MKYKMRVFDFLYNVCLKHLIFYGELSGIWSKMSSGFQVNYLYSCPILINLDFSPQCFEKNSNIKFHENPHSRNSAVACDRMDGRIEWRTDKTKPIVTFRNFPNVSIKFVEGRKLFFLFILFNLLTFSVILTTPFKVVASHAPPHPNYVTS
jgi:hypothetical protein